MKRDNDIEELDDLQEEIVTDTNATGSMEQDIDAVDEAEEQDEHTSEKRHQKLKKALMSSEGESTPTNIRDLFRSIELNGEWFRRNLMFIVVVTLCLLWFVTNRYQAQQEVIEEAKLKKELDDMQYKGLTRFSELTSTTRQSHIEEVLRQHGDTVLSSSREAPFIIRVSE